MLLPPQRLDKLLTSSAPRYKTNMLSSRHLSWRFLRCSAGFCSTLRRRSTAVKAFASSASLGGWSSMWLFPVKRVASESCEKWWRRNATFKFDKCRGKKCPLKTSTRALWRWSDIIANLLLKDKKNPQKTCQNMSPCSDSSSSPGPGPWSCWYFLSCCLSLGTFFPGPPLGWSYLSPPGAPSPKSSLKYTVNRF